MENMENPDNLESRPIFSLDVGKLILPGSIVLAAVLISGTLFFTSYRNNPSAQLGTIGGQRELTEPTADNDPVLGKNNAPVTIIEFSDYQCPFCRAFWSETLPIIKSNYIDTGKVRFVYRDYPLSFHERAQTAAEAAECADDQGKYWQMHDKIFSEQEKRGSGTISFSLADIKKWAVEISLKASDFNQCLDSGKYREEVEKDFSDGSAAGVSGTPAFFINGRLVLGAQPFDIFRKTIEEAMKDNN